MKHMGMAEDEVKTIFEYTFYKRAVVSWNLAGLREGTEPEDPRGPKRQGNMDEHG